MNRFALVSAILLAVLLGCTSQAEQNIRAGMVNPMVAGGFFDDLFGSETSSERASLSDREKAQRFADIVLKISYLSLSFFFLCVEEEITTSFMNDDIG